MNRNEELKDHTRAARHLEITKEQLIEMLQVAHYPGWPTGHFGQKIVLDICDSEEEFSVSAG